MRCVEAIDRCCSVMNNSDRVKKSSRIVISK